MSEHIERRLRYIEVMLAEVLRLTRLSLRGELIIMSTQAEINAAIAQLNEEVAKETTVKDSAIALMSGITQRIDDAIAAFQAANPGLDISALSAVTAKITADRESLAASVLANTPAAPPVP